MTLGPDLDWGRVSWWLFGLALALALGYVLLRFVGTFVFAIFLYYATRPVYRRVRHRIDQPSLAAATSLLLLVLPALILVGYTVAIGYREFRRFADRAGDWAREVDLGEYETAIESYTELLQTLSQPQELLGGNGINVVGDVLLTSIGYLGTLGIFALHLFVIVAVAFYLLRDDQKLSRWVSARFADDRGVLDEYVTVVDDDFNNVFFGNILNAVITGTIGAIVYTALNLANPPGLAIPYAALLGLLTGVASLVPVVGMKLVYVPVGVYLFAVPVVNEQPEAMWFPITFALVSFVVVDTIPDLVLRPYVSGRTLHMGALMLAYVLGPLLFGWYGLFLAPMLLVLVVHFARVVLPELVAGEPIRPYAVDPTYLGGGNAVSASRASASGRGAALHSDAAGGGAAGTEAPAGDGEAAVGDPATDEQGEDDTERDPDPAPPEGS